MMGQVPVLPNWLLIYQCNNARIPRQFTFEEWLENHHNKDVTHTKEYAHMGALASALGPIKTGSTFACDMYHFPESIVTALNEAVCIVCGPQTQWPPREGGDDGSVEEN